MSFIITTFVREGIVMAADSRLSLNSMQRQADGQRVNLAVGVSDTNYKLFLTRNNIGISIYGSAEINGVPIAGFVESFINEKLMDDPPVDRVARLILDYFTAFPGPPETFFHIAGYKYHENLYEQHIWKIDVARGSIQRLNQSDEQGSYWGGEADILARLLQPVGVFGQNNEIIEKLPYYKIPWGFFTLQDAIDFSIFAVRATIQAIRFQPRPKSVGGPIDVLMIKPDHAAWIRRKELHD